MDTLTHEPTVQQQARRIQRPNLLRSIFTNSDDGVDGTPEWQARTAGQTRLRRRIGWWLRNPAHDLLFYWVGTVGLPVVVRGLEPRQIHQPDAQGREQGGWNLGYLRVAREDGSLVTPRPFISWAGPVHPLLAMLVGWCAIALAYWCWRHGLPRWAAGGGMVLSFLLTGWVIVAQNVLAYAGWRFPDGAAGLKLRRWSDG